VFIPIFLCLVVATVTGMVFPVLVGSGRKYVHIAIYVGLLLTGLTVNSFLHAFKLARASLPSC
jgi:hypothetical protein